ncbi:uncharacterized protein LOC132736394 [Ruditapes philippinarum]|uniref:uncharacterized protein LOC132736394 n=1 Tax=Ruditapes philippinarum TaxID=129788 RepID=UPI00295B6272|nr:uncharacterized protein LOC132736394 [Ruditapes philippinarum]
MMLLAFILVYLHIFIGRSYCITIGLPQFESDWLYIKAQSNVSDILVQHNIGTVPGLVEVLVKAVDGPNKDFIFKALGNGERDDDSSEMYGGIIYIYNEVNVRIMAPNKVNHGDQGAAIYTGESPYWRGINYQISFEAEVKVRCWEPTALPTPCFNVTDHLMIAGSPNISETYAEFSHGLNTYPMLVKVRGKLLDGSDPGWYTDAQGSALYSIANMRKAARSGGLKYAYDDNTIRVWTSSVSLPDGVLFTRNDGWGHDSFRYDKSTQGLIQVLAWCDLSLSFQKTLTFGPSYFGEELQIALPYYFLDTSMFLTSAMIEATDGANSGYLFEGVGSAMTNSQRPGTPCGYGGLVYAYNGTILRIWRPDDVKGAAICIPDSMALGTNSQASQSGKLIFRAFQTHEQVSTSTFFRLLGNNAAYNDTLIGTQHVASLLSCARKCLQHNTCITYMYSDNTCNMYNTKNESLIFLKDKSAVWGLV